MANGLTLRPVGALDLDLAAQFHREAFAELGDRPWTRQDVAELLASPGVGGCFVRTEERDIGFCLLRVAADEAELLTLAVAASHRRRGGGRALLQAAIDRARSAGAKSLFLEVEAGNAAARALYAQLGFQVVGRRASYYQRSGRPPAEALVMRLGLTSGE